MRMSLQMLGGGGVPAGRKHGVGMEEQQGVSGCQGSAGRKLGASTARAFDQAGAIVLGNSTSVIGRASVNHDDLIGVRQRCQARGKMAGGVPSGDHHRKPHAEQLAPPSTQNRAQCGWLS